MSQVWEHSEQKGSALILLLAIADFANDDGYAHPGVETLAKKCRMSERNTRYVIDALIASGELEMRQNTGRGGTNEYWVSISKNLNLFDSKGAKVAPRQRLQGCNPASKRVQSSVEKGATAIAPEPLNQKQPSKIWDGFEIAWKAIPKRAGNNPRGAAFKAYRARIAEKHTPVEMIEGAGRYAAFIRATGKEGTEYVMRGSTFLGPDKPFLQPWDLPKPPEQPQRPASWWASDDGIRGKAQELGLSLRAGESWPELRARVSGEIERRKATATA